MVSEVGETALVQTVITLGVLLLAAKLMGELFHRLKQPAIIGMLLGGIIMGPYALGGFLSFKGQEPAISLNEIVVQFGDIAAIVILFIAGLEITPKEFFEKGAASFTVGSLSVIVPFFFGYFVFSFYGFEALELMLIATAITATSIAISVQVLTELGKMKTREARLILGAAIVDDILAIAALSVVTSTLQSGNLEPHILDITFLILQILGLFAAILVGSIFIVPRILHVERLWKAAGSIEGIVTGLFFTVAGIAAAVGLSPIVGSFAVGMAVASSKLIKQIEAYVGKLELIFAPLFFAIIGAQVDLRGINLFVLYVSSVMIAVAIGTKIAGSGLPSILFLKDRSRGIKVGIGMISRGEVGLIVAQAGLTAGALSKDVYTMVVIMVAVTTIITPIWLKSIYQKEKTKEETQK
jgi:Kef-type K+ transport system membrane component KefB